MVIGHLNEPPEHPRAGPLLPLEIGIDGVGAVLGTQFCPAPHRLKLKLGRFQPHIQFVLQVSIPLHLESSLALKLPNGLFDLQGVHLGFLVNYKDEVLELGTASMVPDGELFGVGEEVDGPGFAR